MSEIDVVVPPRFCDAQAMVHASRYHELLEGAFLRWLADAGLAYEELRARCCDLVIGTTTIRYRVPARLGDRLTVRSRASGSTASTVTVDFVVTRDDAVLANASTTYITVRDGASAPLPAELVVPASSWRPDVRDRTGIRQDRGPS